MSLQRAMVVLSAAASLFACGGGATGGAAADSMKYVPEGSTGALVIDVKKGLSSPLLKEEPLKSEIEKMKNEEGFKKMVAAGLDPFSNVNTVVIAGKTDPSKEEFVVILSGSFDAAKVVEKAKAEAKDEKMTFEAAGTGVVLMGPAAAVTAAKAGKGLDGSPELKSLLSLADNSKTIFAVGSIPADLAKGAPIPALQNIKGAGFAADFSNGLSFSALARFASEANATGVKAAAETMLLPMAKGQVPDDVLSALKLEAKGTDLSISINLTTDQLKKLAPKNEPMPAPMPTPDPAAAPGAAPAAP
jgi:hypothetical protein